VFRLLKHVVTFVAVALLALPAVALGSTPTKAASASCKAQLKTSGATAFNQLYKSFGACVSQNAKLTAQQRRSLLSAEKQCRTEMNAGATAFAAKYGKPGKSGKSNSQSTAFGQCVSKLASA
jgi:hypothetical protein